MPLPVNTKNSEFNPVGHDCPVLTLRASCWISMSNNGSAVVPWCGYGCVSTSEPPKVTAVVGEPLLPGCWSGETWEVGALCTAEPACGLVTTIPSAISVPMMLITVPHRGLRVGLISPGFGPRGGLCTRDQCFAGITAR